MNILDEMRLDLEPQVEFLINHPHRMSLHWTQYVGIFSSVTGDTCGCPVQIREQDKTTGIRKVDVILDGGDNDGNRIPNSFEKLDRRWQRAGTIGGAATNRIRRRILQPFLLVRKAVIQYQREQAE